LTPWPVRAAHALRRDGEQLGEFGARLLEAGGLRIGDVVGGDGQIALRRVDAAEGDTE
jgi:hypothetical protein